MYINIIEGMAEQGLLNGYLEKVGRSLGKICKFQEMAQIQGKSPFQKKRLTDFFEKMVAKTG